MDGDGKKANKCTDGVLLVLQQVIWTSVCCINWKSLRYFARIWNIFSPYICWFCWFSRFVWHGIAWQRVAWHATSSWSLTYTYTCVIGIYVKNFRHHDTEVEAHTSNEHNIWLKQFVLKLFMIFDFGCVHLITKVCFLWLEIKVKHQFKVKTR